MKWAGIDTLALRLQNVDPRFRVALAAGCGERVHRVYDNHWVGTHSPAIADAIGVGWSYALEQEVRDDDVRRLIDHVQAEVEYLNEEGITILASSATVSLRILQGIAASTESALAAARALGSSLYVAQLAGDISGAGEGTAEVEELTWQYNAMRIVESWQGALDRGMFAPAGPTPPRWWELYEAGPEHL